MDDDSKWRRRGQTFRHELSAIAIPFVLVSYPLGGALVGKFAGDYFGIGWLMPLGLAAGLYGGIRECIRLLRIISSPPAK
jgi:hypothetical protein